MMKKTVLHLESKGKRRETVAGVLKITGHENIQQCPQEFWKVDLATRATLKGLSLNS